MLGDPSVLRLLPVLSELTINVSAYGEAESGLVTMKTLRQRELALTQMDPSEKERLQGGAQFLRLREALMACPGLERLELRGLSGGAACLFRGGLPGGHHPTGPGRAAGSAEGLSPDAGSSG